MKLVIDDSCNEAELFHYKIVLLTQIIESQNIVNDINKQLEKLQLKTKEYNMAHYISQLGQNWVN